MCRVWVDRGKKEHRYLKASVTYIGGVRMRIWLICSGVLANESLGSAEKLVTTAQPLTKVVISVVTHDLGDEPVIR